jgi:hypothetical protein
VKKKNCYKVCHLEPLDQANKSKSDDDKMWAAVREVGHFYDKLEPMPGAVIGKYDIDVTDTVTVVWT